MDLALGIGCFDSASDCYSRHRLLLVELKLNLEPNTFNPRISELVEKSVSTKTILSGRPLDTRLITLVPTSCFNAAVHRFNSRRRGSGAAKLSSWEIRTPEMFNNLILDNNNCPYHPVNKREDIDKTLANDPTADDLYRFLDYWNNEAQRFVSHHANYHEARHILNSIKDRSSKEIEKIADKDSVDLQLVKLLLDDTDSLIQKYDR